MFQGDTGGTRETYVYNPVYDVELQRFGTITGDESDTDHTPDSWGALSRATFAFQGFDEGEPYYRDTRVLSGAFLGAVTRSGAFRVSRFDNQTNTVTLPDDYYSRSVLGGGGGDGDDEMFGGGGDDSMIGGGGSDTINGQSGNDTINGLAGNDLIFGGADDDVINSGDGNDTEVGPGGTPFMKYLKKHRDENRAQTI